MYGVMLAAMMTAGTSAPDWGCHGRGCHGCNGWSTYNAFSCSGCGCAGYGSCAASYGCGCYGCSSYCGGCSSYCGGCSSYCGGCSSWCGGCSSYCGGYCAGCSVSYCSSYCGGYCSGCSSYCGGCSSWCGGYCSSSCGGYCAGCSVSYCSSYCGGVCSGPVYPCSCGGGVIIGTPATPIYTVPSGGVPSGMPVPEKLSAPPKSGEGVSTGQVTVKLPADAKLSVDGVACPLTTDTRSFRTPKLEAGKEYYYTLTAEVTREGQTFKDSKRVVVQAGRESTVDFGTVGFVETARR